MNFAGSIQVPAVPGLEVEISYHDETRVIELDTVTSRDVSVSNFSILNSDLNCFGSKTTM